MATTSENSTMSIEEAMERIMAKDEAAEQRWLQSARTPRNAKCHCGSGRKYKKCCMEKERNQAVMDEKKNLPSTEEAIQFLHSYDAARVRQHNATVQSLNNCFVALSVLPASPNRDAVMADFERRINEMIGESKGRDAVVTFKLHELMQGYPLPNVEEEGEAQVDDEPEGDDAPVGDAPDAESDESDESDHGEQAVAAELEADVQAEDVEDAVIDEIVGSEAEAEAEEINDDEQGETVLA